MTAKHLKLILGDQLNSRHSWFDSIDKDVVFVIAELHQEASYTKHHIQKITAFFIAMHDFAKTLESKGHRICYLTLDDTSIFEDLTTLIMTLIKDYESEFFSYQRPDEYRLREQLKNLTSVINRPVNEVDTEHFLLPFDELANHFTRATHVRLESFYRHMRKRFSILMADEKPVGGIWNFDSNNRQSFKKTDIKVIPKPLVFNNDASEYLSRIKHHKIKTIGQESKQVAYPINREQALTLLTFFCQNQLPYFGNFQDAMTLASPYGWTLYHSRLSFAINCKILSPMEVIQTAIEAYDESEGKITLPQIEGFVRQILGWREYVRGMYWVNMPAYATQNFLSAQRDLPEFFWHGNTKMRCLHSAITQSLEHAYAHHIQRLMITGNFALLAGISPSQVDEWYLGIYIDAIEWVELPNTRGMALFADGGWIATKPYAASGNYVNKMSDYCKGCQYNVKEKLGDNACPLNSLYWNFIGENYDKLASNHRMSFPVRHWDKMPESNKVEITEHATYLLNNLNSL
jgi:deoxyribodipyrimidine photolyase-related protein